MIWHSRILAREAEHLSRSERYMRILKTVTRPERVTPRQLGKTCVSLVPVFWPINLDGQGLRNGCGHRRRRVIHISVSTCLVLVYSHVDISMSTGWSVAQNEARAMGVGHGVFSLNSCPSSRGHPLFPLFLSDMPFKDRC